MKKKNIAALTALALVAATASLYLVWKKKQQRHHNTPPEGAPQLHIENPGDQSEFPAAPTGEMELG
jgi:LPS O-antigen subunit length determinant protein (WzzB/FepE family)